LFRSVRSKSDTFSCLTGGENGISFLGITGYAISWSVRWSDWSVLWSRYDRTGDKMVALDLEADKASLYCSWNGKQHDPLKKSTMDKTLESTLKAGMNTKLPTCDESSQIMKSHTGNTSSVRWVGGW
jgi:hypothetical protein